MFGPTSESRSQLCRERRSEFHGSERTAWATVDGARDILLDSLAKHLGSWTEHGFDPIRAAWLARAHPVGTVLRASIGGKAEEGRFAGLDDTGAMLLDTAEGRKRIVAAEVSVPSA